MKLVNNIVKRGRLIMNNHTKYSDDLLHDLLTKSMKFVGIRGMTYIEVFYPAQRMPSTAWHRSTYWLQRGKTCKPIHTSGHVHLHPYYQGSKDTLAWGERWVETIIHELNHIKDFEMNRKFGNYNRRWKNRPHEKRAVRNTERLLNGDETTLSERRLEHRNQMNDALLNLCIHIEENKLNEKYTWK